jgi:hypothetical protein
MATVQSGAVWRSSAAFAAPSDMAVRNAVATYRPLWMSCGFIIGYPLGASGQS